MDKNERINERRDFLKKLGAAGLFLSTMGIPAVSGAMPSKALPAIASLPRVNVSNERIIRSVVGLRPYRPAGFNIDTQRLDDTLIVHNYGHGGGGISLSWGTATLAIEKVASLQTDSLAVLGAGVIGLSTAILLLKQGKSVTLYTDRLPPNTTSNVAAAFWAPVSVYESGLVNPSFLRDFNRASKLSQRMFQDLVGKQYGVWWMKSFFLGAAFDFPGGSELYPDPKKYTSENTPFYGYSHTDEFHSLMIEPPIYLKALLDDFFQLGGNLQIRKFHTASELTSLPQKVIMNCTGLGSSKLFNDQTLTPVKGQLELLLPQDEIDYGYVAPTDSGLLYMFPRKDGIVLGGTSEKGSWSLDHSSSERDRIIQGHQRIAASLR